MYNWTDVINYSFQNVWAEFINFLPQLVVALLVLVFGWLIANLLKKVMVATFTKLKVDAALDAAGVDTLVKRAGYTLNSGSFVGSLVKWFIIIVFFVAALDILNLDQATMFLTEVVLSYLPRVIVAVLILFGGLILANVTEKIVVAGGRATSFASSELLGKFAQVAIIVFTALAALNQLVIAPELVQTLFAGLVFALSLAFGLAFGFGGREAAARYLDKITEVDKSSHNSAQDSFDL